MLICGALRDLVLFAQFKNVKKGVLLLVKLQGKACNFNKSTAPPWVFFTFFNCAHGTKSRNAPHLCIFD